MEAVANCSMRDWKVESEDYIHGAVAVLLKAPKIVSRRSQKRS
jgi:hypothetical protein